MGRSRLHQLSELGQSVWIDVLSRRLIQTGELERMLREDAVKGVTSNPTIFEKAVSEGDVYDEQLRACLDELNDPKEIFYRLAVDDIRDALGILRPVWDETAHYDGYVSLEVDPTLAHDTEGTIEEAARFHQWVERPNLYVKIPATAEGLPAYEAYEQIFSSERWAPLAGAGANRQRCLWASTSTKNPEYRDVMYVEGLIGPKTVNTMPLETVAAFQDHGEVALTLEEGVDDAQRLLERLAAAGVYYDDVTATLEREGVEKFSDSFAELIDGIRAKSGELVPA